LDFREILVFLDQTDFLVNKDLRERLDLRDLVAFLEILVIME